MPKGPKGEKRPADVIGASCRSDLARLTAPAFTALGEGQKPQCASSKAGSRRGLGFAKLDKVKNHKTRAFLARQRTIAAAESMQAIKRRLAVAENHIAKGLEHIRHQQRIIAELEREGDHDDAVAQAQSVLKTFTETRLLHEQDREHVLAESKGT